VRIALDTNILAYAEGLGDDKRCTAARSLIECLPEGSAFLPAQTLGELHRILIAKGGNTPALAREAILGWADAFEILDSTWSAFQSAFDLVADHQLQIWDALILAVSAEHRCRLLLSEDLQHGFTWRGVTIVNPFSHTQHPILQTILEKV
jgi:predicted nucleic acid-binding protein